MTTYQLDVIGAPVVTAEYLPASTLELRPAAQVLVTIGQLRLVLDAELADDVADAIIEATAFIDAPLTIPGP